MKMHSFNTPLGAMIATGDDKALYSLEFEDSNVQNSYSIGRTKSIDSIDKELKLYFEGKLKKFCTPLAIRGTAFQKKVWEALTKIAYGQTISYAQLASLIGNSKASRACGNANGANPFAIIIPCHRVIHSHGGLGGYNSGLERKKWLLEHEKINQS